MTAVEEEVSIFGENIQFVVDLNQMHQDLLLERRPARTSMGSQELLGNAMASPGRPGRPRAGRIDEVPKRGRPPASVRLAAFFRGRSGLKSPLNYPPFEATRLFPTQRT